MSDVTPWLADRLKFATVITLGLAAAIAFGMTQHWSFDDWFLVDWLVIILGSLLALGAWNEHRDQNPGPLPWPLVLAVPPALFAGATLLHLRADAWLVVDAGSVVVYVGLGLAYFWKYRRR